MASVPGIHPFSCKFCPRSFSNLARYHDHRKRHKSRYLKHWLRKRSHIINKQHLKKRQNHFEEPVFQQKLFVFMRGAIRVKSITVNEEQKELLYSCGTCNRTFSAEIHLKRHERQAHSRAPQIDSENSDRKKFRCKYCNKTHHNKADLDYHERSAHTGETLTYTCDVCKSTFKRKVYLNRHMRIHNDIRPYVCKICGKSFIKGGGLKEHERTHTGEKPYKCSTCLRGFSGRANLRRHEMTHSGEQPFECKVCGKRCNRIASLRQHMRIHTGERPYNCMHCNKAFPTCANLRRHERTHLEKKQFSCRQCGKEFVQKYTLKLHEMNHLGIRPHLCLLCGKTFMEKRKLRIHLTTSHNITQTDDSENGSQQYELDLANIEGGASINNIPEHLRSKAMEAIEGAHFKSLEDFQAYWKATYLENGSESVGGSTGITESDLMAKQVQSINNFQQIVKNLPQSTSDQQPHVPNQQQTALDKQLTIPDQHHSILNQSQSFLNQQLNILNQPSRILPQQSRIKNQQPNLQDQHIGMPNHSPILAQQDIEKLPLIPPDKLPEALIELAKIDAAKQTEKKAAKKAKKAAKNHAKEASKQAVLNRVVDSLHVKSHIDGAQNADILPPGIGSDSNHGEIQQSKRPKMMPSYVEIPKQDNINSITYDQTQNIFKNKPKGQSSSSIFNKFNAMTGAESFDCIQCGQTFTSQIVLEIHMRTHQREECQSFCVQCNKSFNNILDLEDHILTHNGPQSLEKSSTDELMSPPPEYRSYCSQCDMTFENMKDLEDHIRTHDPLLLQTPVSTSSIPKHNLLKNLPSSSGVSSAPDDSDCIVDSSEMGPIPTSVPKISDGKKNKKVREYPCHVCDKVYRKKQSLKNHLLTHEVGIVPIECVPSVGNIAYPSSDVAASKSDMLHKALKNADESQDIAYESSDPLTKDPDILITGDGNVETITQNVEGDNSNITSSELQLGYMKEFSSSQIKKKIWPCKYCKDTFPIQQLLAGHMNKHRHDKVNRSQTEEDDDDDEKPFSCHICSKRFSRQERLAGHMNKHKDLEHVKIPTEAEAILRMEEFNKEDTDNRWQCPYCESKFDEHDLIVEHVHEHTESRAPFTCDVCYKGFNKKANYQTHMITHSTELKHVCEICNKAFKHVQSLRKHTTRCRTIFHCEQCDETFTLKRLLNSHMWNTHHKEDTCKCKVCGKVMSSSSGLREHEFIHSGEKPYKCRVCTRGFVNRSNLRRHIMIHENDRPFKCNFCNMTFNRLASMQQHERCHTGEKPFKCSYCGICFTSKSTRRKHEKRHSKEKSIKCKFCDKTFWDNYTCRTHERVHTGDLPYECTLCNKKYSERHVLTKHMKTSHKEWYAINMENQNSADKDKESALLHDVDEEDELADINLKPLSDIQLDPLSDDEDNEDQLLQPLSDEDDDDDRVLQPVSEDEGDEYNMTVDTDEEQEQSLVPQSVAMVTND